MKLILTFSLLFISLNTLFGQAQTQHADSSTVFKTIIYPQFSTIFNNTIIGLNIGVVKSLKETKVIKKKNPSKMIKKTKELVFNASYLNDGPSKNYFFASSDYRVKRFLNKNFFISRSIGIGVARSFTYDKGYISSAGGEKGNKWAGNWYFAPSFSIGPGYVISTFSKLDLTPFINFQFRPLIPDYRWVKGIALAEIGVSFKLK